MKQASAVEQDDGDFTDMMDEHAVAQIGEQPVNLVNEVKKITNIEFQDRMSNLINDKGQPVLNQVTPFREANTQKYWEIKSSAPQLERDPTLKKLNQNQIFEMIESINDMSQKIDFRSQTFEQDYDYSLEKSMKLEISKQHELKLRKQLHSNLLAESQQR